MTNTIAKQCSIEAYACTVGILLSHLNDPEHRGAREAACKVLLQSMNPAGAPTTTRAGVPRTNRAGVTMKVQNTCV